MAASVIVVPFYRRPVQSKRDEMLDSLPDSPRKVLVTHDQDDGPAGCASVFVNACHHRVGARAGGWFKTPDGSPHSIPLVRQEDQGRLPRSDQVVCAQLRLHHADRPVRQPQQMADLVRDRQADDVPGRERRQRWMRRGRRRFAAGSARSPHSWGRKPARVMGPFDVRIASPVADRIRRLRQGQQLHPDEGPAGRGFFTAAVAFAPRQAIWIPAEASRACAVSRAIWTSDASNAAYVRTPIRELDPARQQGLPRPSFQPIPRSEPQCAPEHVWLLPSPPPRVSRRRRWRHWPGSGRCLRWFTCRKSGVFLGVLSAELRRVRTGTQDSRFLPEPVGDEDVAIPAVHVARHGPGAVARHREKVVHP